MIDFSAAAEAGWENARTPTPEMKELLDRITKQCPACYVGRIYYDEAFTNYCCMYCGCILTEREITLAIVCMSMEKLHKTINTNREIYELKLSRNDNNG